MKEVIFHEPVYIGDLVSFYARTVKVGNTSITIHVVVEAERFGTPGVIVKVTEAEVTFVAIDETGKKVHIGK
jgi:acyl-CoA thioesterase YciA